MSSRSLRHHGAPAPETLRAWGVDPTRVTDFSTSVPPFGPPPSVAEAVRTCPLHAYPDPLSTLARSAIAASTGTSDDRVLVGPGATDLLWLIARSICAVGSLAVVAAPAFSEFAAGASDAGADVIEHRALPGNDYRPDLADLATFARTRQASVVHLANPTSPIGAMVDAHELRQLAEGIAPRLLVLDESFLSLSDTPALLSVPLPDNVVRVRSLTKDFRLAGLRVGYLLAAPALLEVIARRQPPWSVSTPAQAAVMAAMHCTEWLEQQRTRLLVLRDELVHELGQRGLAVVPSHTHYVTFKGDEPASALQMRLLRHGIVVRDCASFGLPFYVRLGTRTRVENHKLLQALDREVRR